MKVAEEGRQRETKAAPKKKRTVRVPKNAGLVRFFLHPAGKILLIAAVLLIVGLSITFGHFYHVYAKLIDQRLRGGPYTSTSRIYAAPSVHRRG